MMAGARLPGEVQRRGETQGVMAECAAHRADTVRAVGDRVCAPADDGLAERAVGGGRLW